MDFNDSNNIDSKLTNSEYESSNETNGEIRSENETGSRTEIKNW